jgi:hypothetical protein
MCKKLWSGTVERFGWSLKVKEEVKVKVKGVGARSNSLSPGIKNRGISSNEKTKSKKHQEAHNLFHHP